MASIQRPKQECLRIGDTVLLSISEGKKKGYLYHEISSSPFNFITIFPGSKETNFPNVTNALFRLVAESFETAPEKKTTRVTQSSGKSINFGDRIQLQHVGSTSYLSLAKEISKTESNNHLVYLSESGNTRLSTFRVLPRYKHWLDGDAVRYGEQVKLESVQSLGRYFHCSNHTLCSFKIPAIDDHYELNVSAFDSAVTFYLHSAPTLTSPSTLLKGGCCVRLFHGENECYLAAEGSFGINNGEPELDVHCRQRHVNKKGHSHPSTSANTYWRIEKESDPHNGDALAWDDRCRIIHLPTRRYLAVVGTGSNSYQVTLKPKAGSDWDTIFSLHPIIDNEDSIHLGSYAHIHHVLTGTWLHLEKNKPVYKRRGSDQASEALEGLEWDSAQLFSLTSSKNKREYDAFILQEVPPDLVNLFNYVAGMVPVLQAHVEELNDVILLRKERKQTDSHEKAFIPRKRINLVIDCLTEFGEWLCPALDLKKKQKLLRNLQVIELVIKILENSRLLMKKYYSVAGESSPYEVSRKCYDILTKFVLGESRKNENYLARYIKIFLSQISKGLHTEEFLVELLENNWTIISVMTKTTMKDVIEKLQKKKNPIFLKFLSRLCICCGRPVPHTQEKILKELVQAHGRELFIMTQVRTDEVVQYRRKAENGSPTWVSLEELKPDDACYEFLCAQLDLFRSLCEGNNDTCIKELVSVDSVNGYLTFNEAMFCARNPRLDPHLRSKYIQLITVMFVNCGDNRPFLDQLPCSFVYDKLVPNPYEESGDDEMMSLTGVKNCHFPVLKQWILNTIENDEMVYSTNSLVAEVVEKTLEVLCHFIRLGYFDSLKDVKIIVKSLTNLLDEKTGRTEKFGDKSSVLHAQVQKAEDSLDVPSIIKLKLRALEALDLFMNFMLFVQLQKFLNQFRELNASLNKQTFHNLCGLFLEEDSQLKKSSDMNVYEVVQENWRTICNSDSGFLFVGSEHDSEISTRLCDVLLDLCQNENTEICQRSLKILIKMHFHEKDTFDHAVQAQLLTEVSVEDYVTSQKMIPQFHHLLSLEYTQENLQTMVEILQKLTDLCYIPYIPGSHIIPNPQNQLLIKNLGVFSDVLSHLLVRGTDVMTLFETTEGKAQLDKFFQQCFAFLQAVAIGNTGAKKQLLNNIDELLKLKVSLPCIAELIKEVFTGEAELCLEVKEEHIAQIFDIIVNAKDPTIQVQFIEVLQTMAKIHLKDADLPVMQNQDSIIRYFCKQRDGFSSDLFDLLVNEDKRWKLLTCPEEDSNLNWLLSVIELLATCAEGENAFIDSVCQTILPIEELISIITRDLPLVRKRPFLRFLTWVYMDSEESNDDSKVDQKKATWRSSLTHSESMWTFLEQVSMQLGYLHRLLQLIPDDQEQLVKYCLDSSSSLCTYSYASPKPPLTISTTGDITIEGIINGGVFLTGVLEYFIEAVLPLIHTFFSRFSEPRHNEIEVSIKLLKSLLELNEDSLLPKYFTFRSQHNFYLQVINTLIDIPFIADEMNFDQEKMLKWFNSGQVLLKSTPNEALQKYEEQEQLNKELKRFTLRYQEVYVGPNTVDHQVLSLRRKSGKTSKCKLKYSCEGEELPLGHNFQKLVSHFAKQMNKKKGQVNGNQGHQTATANTEERPLHASLLTSLRESFKKEMDINERERKEQADMDIRCLQILRAIIHNQIAQKSLESKERKPKEYRKHVRDNVRPVQYFVGYSGNAMETVLPLLNHTNPSIVHETLVFLKALLYAGNKTGQENLLKLNMCGKVTPLKTLKNRLSDAALYYEKTIRLIKLFECRKKVSTRIELQIMDRAHPAIFGLPLAIEIEDIPFDTASLPLASSLSQLTGSELMLQEHHNTRESKTRRTTSTDPLLTGIQLQQLQDGRADSSKSVPSRMIKEEALAAPFFIQKPVLSTAIELKVIGLMCDGQRRAVQDYLREQTGSNETVNILDAVTQLLQSYISDPTPAVWKDLNALIEALIELCVANVENQKIILDDHVVYYLMIILKNLLRQSAPDDDDDVKWVVRIQENALQLVSIMLEETHTDSANVIKRIGSSIDMDTILNTLDYFYEKRMTDLMLKLQLENNCERAMFTAFHICTTLIKAEAIPQDYFETVEQTDIVGAVNHCKTWSCSIEVNYKMDDNEFLLTAVHFPFDPDNKLKPQVKDKVSWSICRDSLEAKQRELLQYMVPLKHDLEHQIKLNKGIGSKMFSPQKLLSFSKHRHILLILLTVLLNLMVLFSFHIPSDLTNGSIVNDPDTHQWFEYGLYTLGIIHLFLSSWRLVEYFIRNFPHFHLPTVFPTMWEKIRKGVHKLHKIFTKKETLKKENMSKLPPSPILNVNIFGVKTLYLVVFFASSFLSLFFDGYLYCICLLYVIVNNDILLRVLRAVTQNGKTLLWVAALLLIVLFIYAVISFATLHNHFDPGSDDGQLFCASLLQCTWSVVRYGLLDNIGLIIPLDEDEQTTFSNTYFLRLIFDLSFFIIVTTIGLNVVFGIIVDAFAELRDEKYKIQEDMKSKCFICDIASHKFDRKAGGFNYHVKEQHNMWNYIYYSMYLDSIDIHDHTAIEKFVFENLRDRKAEFFPHEEALCLSRDDGDVENRILQVQKSLEQIQNKLEEKEKMERLAAKKAEQKKRERDMREQQESDCDSEQIVTQSCHRSLLTD